MAGMMFWQWDERKLKNVKTGIETGMKGNRWEDFNCKTSDN
jgi:hypothetical protein